MERTLHNHAWRRIRAAFYAFDLSRFPFGKALGRKVSAWETEQGFGDSPKAKSRWDADYSSGRWDYLGSLKEASHYYTIIGYMAAFKGAGAYLDVGCGDGVLFERFRPFGYTRYVGIDISDVAIAKLATHNDERTVFAQADGDTYVAAESFDAIVLNESLYYLRHPLASLHRYAQALKPDGAVIVSTYTGSRRSVAVLREAKNGFDVIDETLITQGAISWICTVMKPK